MALVGENLKQCVLAIFSALITALREEVLAPLESPDIKITLSNRVSMHNLSDKKNVALAHLLGDVWKRQG